VRVFFLFCDLSSFFRPGLDLISEKNRGVGFSYWPSPPVCRWPCPCGRSAVASCLGLPSVLPPTSWVRTFGGPSRHRTPTFGCRAASSVPGRVVSRFQGGPNGVFGAQTVCRPPKGLAPGLPLAIFSFPLLPLWKVPLPFRLIQAHRLSAGRICRLPSTILASPRRPSVCVIEEYLKNT